ncbi:tetratricopeptide repeat protein [Qipengyuania sp. DGS5-3]|uniref:tetratricopeptide repeat protein n=1 Tax=Qipengyuania sp. DGS5-3 TaxID=3349632 RepID=UPI0036D35431
MKARPIIFAALAASVLAVPAPVIAQDNNDELRIRKLEAEVRALQRRVFPGSDGRFFEPEITGAPASTATNNATSTTAVTDILSRLGALETQIQRLTATTERNENAIGILTERLDSIESGSSSGSLPEGTVSAPSTAPATSLTPAPTTTQQTGAQAATTPAATGPSAERLEAVQAIAKPQSDDPADDEYSYGFRLWNAGFYPEAQQQLAMFIDRYPSHWRVTYGRNLLGRAYMDDNKPREAAPWFLNNYQADKTAARAGDSLLYLSEAMIALEDTQRACIALSEFAETYPALASGRLQGQYERNRARVTCN